MVECGADCYNHVETGQNRGTRREMVRLMGLTLEHINFLKDNWTTF